MARLGSTTILGSLTTSGIISTVKGIYFNGTSLGLKKSSGAHGTVETIGTTGNYGGYSIGGNAIFMSSGSAYGLYDQTNSRWGFLAYHSGSSEVHYAGAAKLTTTAAGVTIAGTATATAFSGPLSGNASTASTWATARTLTLTGGVTGSVSMNGSANVSLAATVANDSHTHYTQHPYVQGRVVDDCNAAQFRNAGMYGFNNNPANTPGPAYLAMMVASNADVGLQIAGGYNTNELYFRGWWSSGGAYSSWHRIIHSGNYTAYTPSLTGAGASGTWGISITGNSGSVGGVGIGGLLRSDVNNVLIPVSSGDGNGVRFWDRSAEFAIWMSAAGNAAYGGRVPGEGTSDYNMYFRMGGGTNRGFVFESSTGAKIASINPNGFYCSPVIYTSIVAAANRVYASYDAGVSGSMSCSNWFRSSGATGWFNSTYGGGVTMEDATWVRIYGSKSLHITGQVAATGNVTAYYSDGRLKDIISEIDPKAALNSVSSWRKIRYTANQLANDLANYDMNRVDIGLLTQEVEAEFPEVIHDAPFDIGTTEEGERFSKSGESYKTLDYGRTAPILAAAITALKDENSILREELEALKIAIKNLTALAAAAAS